MTTEQLQQKNWPDDVRLEMIRKSEYYQPNERIYQYGYYDGYQLAASLAGDGWVGVEPDFLEYVRNAKDEFITKFNNEERSVYLKVAVEDLIIAYDQMKDKFKAKG